MSSAEQLARELATRSTPLVVVESLILIAFDFLAISGNLLVCCVAYKTRRSQTVAKTLIAALAFTDLAVSILSEPLSITALAFGHWNLGHRACVFQGFCMVYFATASTHTLALISISRYLCVVRPSYFRRFCTVKKTIWYVVIVWILACLGSIPPLFFGMEDYAFQAGKAICLYPFELTISYTISIDTIFIILPMIVMVLCYSQVFKKVRASTGQLSLPNGACRNRAALAINIKETKITKTLVVVLLGFASCWLPIGVLDIIDTSRGSPTLPRQLYLFYGHMAYLSSTINPFIYGMMSRRFRREFMAIFLCKSKGGASLERAHAGARPQAMANVGEAPLAQSPYDVCHIKVT